MRLILCCAFLLISAFSYAQSEDRSAQMVKILSENKVHPWGKRRIQEATLICKTARKHKIETLMCTVDVTPPGNELPIVYEELYGEKAVEVSDLLKMFGVRPSGKRSYQKADIRCQLPKKRPELSSNCILIPVDEFRGL